MNQMKTRKPLPTFESFSLGETLNIPKEGDMKTKNGKAVVKSLNIGDTDRAFGIMSSVADKGTDQEWADCKKVYGGFNDELKKLYIDYNKKMGGEEWHRVYESVNEARVDAFIENGKKNGLTEFDLYDNNLYFTDGAYIEFRIKLGSDMNSIKTFTAKDNGNRKSMNLGSKYKTLDDVDVDYLKKIKEI